MIIAYTVLMFLLLEKRCRTNLIGYIYILVNSCPCSIVIKVLRNKHNTYSTITWVIVVFFVEEKYINQ